MAKLFNRAKMTTTTTGSGTITLGSASNGFQSFADAGVADGDVVQYVIEEGANFEIGTGTYSATGTSLTRTPSESSNSNNAIALAGQATVSITAVADDLNRLQHNGTDKVTVSSTGASVTGNLSVSGTVDGVDVSARDAVLTSTTTTANAALPKAGGTITSGTNTGLTINHDTFAEGLVIHRNHASNNAAVKFKNNTGIAGVLWAQETGGQLYWRERSGTTNHRVFHDNYHPNADKWTTSRTLSLTGDVTGSVSIDGSANASITATVGNDSHTHAFNNLTGKTSGTGDYATTGAIQSGKNSGGVALTINDGYGNANVTWNHKSGVPEQTGQAARIEVNTDAGSGSEAEMSFELSSAVVTSGAAVNLPVGMKLAHDYVEIPNQIRHQGDTDTYMQFHDANSWRVVTGGTERIEATNSGIRIDDAFTLPTTDGSANQVLTTDGSGNVSWTTQIDTDTNTTYSLKAQQTSGTDANPNLWLDASSGTDDYVQLVGSGATTVTRNSDGQITISSTDTNTDTNTTYSLKAQQTGGTDANPNILLDASTGTDDTIQLVGGGATTITRNSDGQITISSTDTNTDTNQLTTFQLEDGDGTEVTVSHGKEVKFVEGGGIDINWTDTSTGSDGDPYDLTFTADSNKYGLARLLGWEHTYGSSNYNDVYYDEAEDAVALFSSSDTSIGMAFRAVAVTAGQKVKFTINLKSSAADSDGLYLRLYYYTGDFPDGKTHVSNSSSGGSSFVQEDTDGDNGWYENGAHTTSWRTFERVWTAPTTGYVSLVILNWTGFSGTLYAKQPDIETQSTASANKWTTARTHTVTLTGDVTGTASNTVDGSGNKTWTINASVGDAETVDGFNADRFMRRIAKATATVGGGWMTVASNTSGRKHGEVVVTDGDSGDHAFIRIDWMRSYQDSNFTVINCGGHANRITGARVLYQTSDDTYGTKLLQVYVTTSSNYEVNIYEHGDIDDYGSHSVVTPVIENTKTGYAVHGNQLETLDTYGFAVEEGLRVGGNGLVDGDLQASGLYVGSANTSYDFYNNGTSYLNGATTIDADTQINGVATISTTSDAQILLQSTNSWTGIGFNDSGSNNEYIWHNGGNGTFAIGGGGSNVNGKKLHIDGGTTIGVNYDATSTHTNGLKVEGHIETAGEYYAPNKIIHTGDTDTYMQFGTNQWNVYVGNSREITVDTTGVRLGDTGNGYFQPVSGNYGSIQIDGGAHGGWEGYSIGGRAVFMHDNSSATGIYNDVDNQWLFYGVHGGETRMYHAGTWAFRTNSATTVQVGNVSENSSYILMSDADHGGRYIHCNSNRIGFLDSSNAWSFWSDDAGDINSERGANFGSATLSADGQNDVFMFATSATSATAQSGAFHNKLRILGGSSQTRDLQLYQVDSEYSHIGSSWTNNQLHVDSNFTQVHFNQPLYIPDYIYHKGDTNTYMQFHAADQWRVVVGGSERLEVKNSSPHVLVTGDLNSTSDARLKENVEPIANALSDITQLEGVSFDWKDTGTRGHGFIAQQVEPILPDVVNTDDETGIKSINYVGMIGHLVEAIKEQQTQIDALTAQVKELKR